MKNSNSVIMSDYTPANRLKGHKIKPYDPDLLNVIYE
jgi:hypothetical protein